MKTHFITLFDYDNYANALILNEIEKAGNPEKPAQLMAHLAAAQKVWVNRCVGLPQANVELWPALGTVHAGLSQLLNSNYAEWIGYIAGLDSDDFDKIIAYQNMKGDNFEDTLLNIITHVINHGTHHRAQIGQLLKLSGTEKLPSTDYIFYVRTKEA